MIDTIKAWCDSFKNQKHVLKKNTPRAMNVFSTFVRTSSIRP